MFVSSYPYFFIFLLLRNLVEERKIKKILIENQYQD